MLYDIIYIVNKKREFLREKKTETTENSKDMQNKIYTGKEISHDGDVLFGKET